MSYLEGLGGRGGWGVGREEGEICLPSTVDPCIGLIENSYSEYGVSTVVGDLDVALLKTFAKSSPPSA